MKYKDYDEAYKAMMSTPWKAMVCTQGTDCWCRIVTPRKNITYDWKGSEEEMYVAASGTLDKKTAKYIVKLHNDNLKKGE